MSDDPDIIVCGAGPPAVPGAVWELCSRCGAAVTIAPSGQKLRAERDLTIICLVCALLVTDMEPEPPTPEQAVEIALWAWGRLL